MLTHSFLRFEEEHMKDRKTKKTVWADLIEGWKILKANRDLWVLTWIVAVTNAAEGIYSSMIIFFAKDSLQMSSGEIGVVLSCIGAGSLIANTLVTRLREKFRSGRVMGVMLVFVAAAYALMYFATNMYMMALSVFMEGFFATIYVVMIWSVRQETTEAHVMGRVSGITGSIFKLLMTIDILAAGWLVEWMPVSYVFLISMALNLLMFVVFARSRLWNMK